MGPKYPHSSVLTEAEEAAVSAQETPWIWWDNAPRQIRVDEIAERVPEEDWHRLSAGRGAKGERLYEWALIERFRWATPPGIHRLLVRRSLMDPKDRAYYIVFSPEGGDAEGPCPGGRHAMGDRDLLRGRKAGGRTRSVRGEKVGCVAIGSSRSRCLPTRSWPCSVPGRKMGIQQQCRGPDPAHRPRSAAATYVPVPAPQRTRG